MRHTNNADVLKALYHMLPVRAENKKSRGIVETRCTCNVFEMRLMLQEGGQSN